jgi:hypothetical protein
MKAIGRTTWVIPGGHIPPRSTGPEPEFTSRDELFVLNTGDAGARLALTIFYADREPIGPYELTVDPRRVRRVRCNDLIDPEAMPLGVDYGVLVESSVPVVVQFTRLDTSQPALALLGTQAFPADG